MLKPRVLEPGSKVAVVAPASAFAREEFDEGVLELRRLGLEPVYDDRVFERHGYVAGRAEVRARSFLDAWEDPGIAALVAVRGGYGSVQILPWLAAVDLRQAPKAFIGYSDNTSILAWLTTRCGITSFHGPMLERRLARGEAGYDRDTFRRSLMSAEPAGPVTAPEVEVIRDGEAAGTLVGGTLTQLVASLGTPYAFDPPAGCILFLEEIAERPYRLDRMLVQLRFAGLLERAAAVVFGEMPGCDEPGENGPSARGVIAEVLAGFPGPVLYGLRSGHTTGACLTLPFGVRARIVTRPQAGLVIEEAAVSSS